MAQADPIHINGTTLEGGGQLVRISLGLSALTGRAIRITSIRGNRSRGGGLKGQHLVAAQWLANACAGGAEVQGLKLGSQTLTFAPRASLSQVKVEQKQWWQEAVVNLPDGTQIAARATVIDLKTPGAITLVLQALLPFLLFSPPSDRVPSPLPILLKVRGGTNVSMSPSIDYIKNVLFPNLLLLFPNIPGLQLLENLKWTRRGWSTGNTTLGEASFLITPLQQGTKLEFNRMPLLRTLHETNVVSLKAVILASSTTPLLTLVESTLQHSLRKTFRSVDRSNVSIYTEDSANLKRLYLLVVAQTSSGVMVGSDWLFDRRIDNERKAFEKVAETLVDQVMDDLLTDLNSKKLPLDRHMVDQIAIFQGLASSAASEESSLALSSMQGNIDESLGDDGLHAATARWISSLLLGAQYSPSSAASVQGVGFVSGAIGENLRY